MEADALAEARCRHFHTHFHQIVLPKVPAMLLRLAAQHRPGPAKPIQVSDLLHGAYNYCYVVTFDDGFKSICRFPILGQNWFRREQTSNTVNTVRFIHEANLLPSVPVPEVLGRGHCEIGPYAIYEYVDGIMLHRVLTNPDAEYRELRPGVTDAELYRAYKSMANIWLDLYQREYRRAGAISLVKPETDSGMWQWKVSKRPLTYTMNELARIGSVPHHLFPDKSFQTTAEYFDFQAELQFLNLKHQRNNAIIDELDCREKYVARCLFRKVVWRLARRSEKPRGSFKLFCDDLRPGNVLVKSKDDFTITGVIDWDFSYTAPAEFLEAAPWWLLLENPLDYGDNLWKFRDLYQPKLELWLKAMRECEEERLVDERLASMRLSDEKADERPEGTRPVEDTADERPEGTRPAEKMADERPEGTRQAENTADERPEGTRPVKKVADERPKGTRLSDKMAASMNNGVFWVTLALRKHFLFDDIFWVFLDEQFFGKFTSLEDRIALLAREERDGMEEFVKMKMEQKLERSIVAQMPLEQFFRL